MKQMITGVDPDSIAYEIGMRAGDALISINGEAVEDVVDYEHLSSEEELLICYESNGELYEAEVEKEDYEPLGLQFSSGLMSSIRRCHNRCVFCFVDQMPRGLRPTLSVKDDDWRMSFIMGNYITLTNIDEAEFERILRRKAGPLYVSVHSTDPQIRVRMMGNPDAARITERLKRLAERGITVHCQIVLCPEINDGAALDRTIRDLKALRPYIASAAVIPVGLTKYREGLYPLRCFTREEAANCISQIEALDGGDGFVWASDEFYILAGMELPEYERYGDFVQLENGVGLLRKFEREFLDALEDMPVCGRRVRLHGASGAAAHGFMSRLLGELERKNIGIELHRIENAFFGSSVTVSGLIVGGDLLAQLKGATDGLPLVIPHSMLREGEDVFLDGMALSEVSAALGSPIWPLCPFDGERFLFELYGKIEEQEKEI